MASQLFYTLEACLQNATERQTALAASVAHLFKSSLVPTSSSTKAELTAAECDWTGYATKALAAWLGPILAPGSGYEIIMPLVLWDTGAADPAVGNDVGGAWIEDAAGKVRMVAVFDTPMPMQVAHDGIPLSLIDFFPTGV